MRELEMKGTVGGKPPTLCPLSIYIREKKVFSSIENEWTLSLTYLFNKHICNFNPHSDIMMDDRHTKVT